MSLHAPEIMQIREIKTHALSQKFKQKIKKEC